MDLRQTRFSDERRSGDSAVRKAGWWTGIAGGGALAVVGLTRRSWPGVALAAAGGLMVAGGVRQLRNRRPEGVHVERSFHINRPVDEVYSFWRNFENLPKFMRHLKSVTVNGDKESTWVARAPVAGSITWEAEIVDEQPSSFIVWRSKEGAMVPNNGSVLFERASDYHGGTKLTVVLNYEPPAGKLGSIFATMFGEDADQQVREDLRRFKQLMEAGEIATTVGQSHGRRTAFVRMVQAATSDEPRGSEQRGQIREMKPRAM
jgi:uncharacterized membrane protein